MAHCTLPPFPIHSPNSNAHPNLPRRPLHYVRATGWQVSTQQEVNALPNVYDQVLFRKQVRVPREWPYVFVQWLSTGEVSFLPHYCVQVPIDYVGMAEEDGPLCFWSRHFMHDTSNPRATSQADWKAALSPPIPEDLLLSVYDNPGTPVPIPVGARPPLPPVYSPEEAESGALLSARGIGGLVCTTTCAILPQPTKIKASLVGGGYSVTFLDHASWVSNHPTAGLVGTRYIHDGQLWVAKFV